MNDDDSSRDSTAAAPNGGRSATLWGWLRGLRRGRNGENSLRETLEELIEDGEEESGALGSDERTLLANILELRGRTVHDVMVPRVDITAVEVDAALSDVIEAITKWGHSRLPVFRGTLDDAIGMVHIKDVLAWWPKDEAFSLSKILRRVLFVSPSMHVLELLLEMQVKRSHMALVVDEFGGVDGLVTIEDLVEEIVGEIEDEHDTADQPQMAWRADGSLDADARTTIEDLEEMVGPLAAEEDREDIDTLGGLVFSLAGRVPMRGELIHHQSGLEFEVLDADPRRIKKLRLRGLSPRPENPD